MSKFLFHVKTLPDCLEQVVERDARCYLPWGLGLAKGTYTPYNKKIFLFFKICIYIYEYNYVTVSVLKFKSY